MVYVNKYNFSRLLLPFPHGPKDDPIMATLQVDACSVLPDAFRDKDGNVYNVVKGLAPDGTPAKKVATYMYSFLLVPIHPDLKPRFVGGLLST